MKYFNVRNNAIELVAGSLYIVKIEPLDLITQDGVRELPVEKRKCLYRDEKELPFIFVSQLHLNHKKIVILGNQQHVPQLYI